MTDLPRATPMWFSATHACARCWLRFPSRATCPSCGSSEVLSLRSPVDRMRYIARACAESTAPSDVWRRLTTRSPGETNLEAWGITGGAALVAASLVAYGGRMARRSVHAGDGGPFDSLAAIDLALLVLAAFGAVHLVFALGRRHARAVAARASGAEGAGERLRVHQPALAGSARDATTLVGIARRASVEIPGALGGETCLVFGVLGAVGRTDVADADGGDFDLELANGERVMVSLEHAVVRAPASATPTRAPVPVISDVLGELLASRAIAAAAPSEGSAEQPVLEEHLLRDGDEVTVIGTILGGTVTSFPAPAYRAASRTRVIGGDPEHPLVVQLGAVSSVTAG